MDNFNIIRASYHQNIFILKGNKVLGECIINSYDALFYSGNNQFGNFEVEFYCKKKNFFKLDFNDRSNFFLLIPSRSHRTGHAYRINFTFGYFTILGETNLGNLMVEIKGQYLQSDSQEEYVGRKDIIFDNIENEPLTSIKNKFDILDI